MCLIPGIADGVEGSGKERVDCTPHAAIPNNLARPHFAGGPHRRTHPMDKKVAIGRKPQRVITGQVFYELETVDMMHRLKMTAVSEPDVVRRLNRPVVTDWVEVTPVFLHDIDPRVRLIGDHWQGRTRAVFVCTAKTKNAMGLGAVDRKRDVQTSILAL
jgi:hypothetical protein